MSGEPRMWPSFDGRARIAFVVALLTLVGSGLGFRSVVSFFNVHLTKRPVQLRQHLATIPRQLGRWESTLEDVMLDEASVEELGTDVYLNRVYDLNGSPNQGRIVLHIAYYTGMIDAVPHIPDRCAVAAGWDPLSVPHNYDLQMPFPGAIDQTMESGRTYRSIEVIDPLTGRDQVVRLPFGDPRLRVSSFGRDDQPQIVHHGGFLFIANNTVTVSPASIRLLAFHPSEQYAYYCKVQMESTLRAEDDAEQFVERCSDLLERAIPHLMRCLPDWAEVESRDDDADTASN